MVIFDTPAIRARSAIVMREIGCGGAERGAGRRLAGFFKRNSL
jgi:hypothetical protein